MIPIILIAIACKGGTIEDTASDDSVPVIDSRDSVDSVDEPFVCTPPTFTSNAAYEWGQAVTLGGYSLTTSDSRVWITAPYQGEYYGVDLGTESGAIESLAQVKLTTTPSGADKMSVYNGHFVAADAATSIDESTQYSGTSYVIHETIADSLTGVLLLSDVASMSVEGENDLGFVGGGIVYDVNLDGKEDFVTASGPIPSTISIFDGITSGDHLYSDGIIIDACDESNLYATTSYAIFGMHSTYLAVGCPGSAYRTGEVLIFELPLNESSVPVYTVGSASGWYVDGNEGTPLVVDSRGNDSMFVILDGEDGSFSGEIVFSDGGYYGSTPTIRKNVDGCFSVVFGDHDYPGDDTGALYHLILGPDGIPQGDPEKLLIPVPEGMNIRWIGAVNSFSPDGSWLASSGWERASPNQDSGGGMVVYTIQD